MQINRARNVLYVFWSNLCDATTIVFMVEVQQSDEQVQTDLVLMLNNEDCLYTRQLHRQLFRSKLITKKFTSLWVGLFNVYILLLAVMQPIKDPQLD